MQPLAPKGKGYHPVSEESLAMASEARGQAGMLRTSAPIGSEMMLSSGPTDKVGVNDQPYNNTIKEMQGMRQNMYSAIPQAQSNAVRGVNKGITDQSQAEYKAQQQLARYESEIPYANDGGSALMQINELAADPATMKNYMGLVADAKLQGTGNNPQTAFQSTTQYVG